MIKHRSPKLALLLVSCLLLIIYGTLYPLANWRLPDSDAMELLLAPHGGYSLPDLVTNYVIYIPAGGLGMSVLPVRSPIARIILVVALLSGLSLLLEIMQTMLPSRVSSVTDTMLNAAGAATGALIAPVLVRLLAITGQFHRIRQTCLRDDAAARAAIAALLLWLLAQWTPFVPYIDPYAMWGALEPLRKALHGADISIQRIIEHCLELTALGILLNSALRNPYTSTLWLAGLLGLGLAGNSLIITQQIYPERLVGVVSAIFLSVFLQGPRSRARSITGLALLASGVLVGKLWPPFSAGGTAFNWVPLKGQLLHPLLGIRDMLDGAWPYCALAALCSLTMRLGWFTLVLGGVLVLGYAGTLEWAQQWQPNRYPDITDVLLAGVGWAIGHAAASRIRRAIPQKQPGGAQRAPEPVQRHEKNSVSPYNVNETS